MKLSFVSLEATDKLVLPGLLYEPDHQLKAATIWLHGMGDNAVFYKPALINELGKAHAEKGIAFLAFNNRGAHNQKYLKIADESLPEEDRDYQGGTHYELISDCVKDIDGAVDFLKARGYKTLYLAGHSTGANKICVYDSAKKQTPFTRYVLAGPGDDTGLFFTDLGEKKYWQSLKHAGKLIGNDKPLDTMPKYTGMYPFSAQSTWDILNPDGAYNTFPYYEQTTERLGQKPLFKEFSSIQTPTLVIIGAQDEYMFTADGADKALKMFLQHTQSTMIKKHDFELVKNADHSFRDYEADFAQHVADWLADA